MAITLNNLVITFIEKEQRLIQEAVNFKGISYEVFFTIDYLDAIDILRYYETDLSLGRDKMIEIEKLIDKIEHAPIKKNRNNS